MRRLTRDPRETTSRRDVLALILTIAIVAVVTVAVALTIALK